MKRPFALALLGAALTGCGGGTTSGTSTTSSGVGGSGGYAYVTRLHD